MSQETANRVKAIIVDKLGVDENEVTETANFHLLFLNISHTGLWWAAIWFFLPCFPLAWSVRFRILVGNKYGRNISVKQIRRMEACWSSTKIS